MKKLRAVIIGTGAISHTHAEAIKNSVNIELTACWNRIEEEVLGQQFGERHHVTYYSDLDKMLETETADIVINALPPKYHMQGVEKAASLGANLVVEKPMALSTEDCRKIISIAENNGVMLAVSESSGFDKMIRAIETHRETLGHVLHMTITNYRQYFSPERSKWIFDIEECPGGMIQNVGVHRIAAMRQISGSKEKQVLATIGSRAPEIPVPGDCSMRIEYDNGAVGNLLMCGYCKPGSFNPNINHIVTSKGHLRLQDGTLIFSDMNGNDNILPLDEQLSTYSYQTFYDELGYSIINKLQSPYSGDTGMRDVAVVEAALLSSREKRIIELEDLLENEKPSQQLLPFRKII